MILIALSGKKRSGKNTVAKLIASLTPLRCKEFAFADELKIEVAKMCKVSVTEIEKNKPLYRGLLQAWGVYQRETKGEHYWIAIECCKIQYYDGDIAIITDCRFINEFAAMKTAGAYLVRVQGRTVDNDTHISEVELDNMTFPHTVWNGGTLDDLAVNVLELMQTLKIPIKE
jgi:hypothetical protein